MNEYTRVRERTYNRIAVSGFMKASTFHWPDGGGRPTSLSGCILTYMMQSGRHTFINPTCRPFSLTLLVSLALMHIQFPERIHFSYGCDLVGSP